MTADLIAFLRARLDEDAQTARDATEGPWCADHPEPRHWGDDPESALIVRGEVLCILDNQHNGPLNVDHIARHDPARVLKDIEAKRQTLQELEQAEFTLSVARPGTPPHDLMTGAVNTLRRVVCRDAAVHDDHPDYDERWRL